MNDYEKIIGEPLNVTDEKAREMILSYMKIENKAMPSDISRHLRLDFEQVMRVTVQLIEDGKLE